MMTIGRRVREAREEKGWTQAWLAATIKPRPMAQQSIQEIESGETKNPRPETLAKIAQALGVTKEWLLVGDKVKKHDPTYFIPIFSFSEVINWPHCMEAARDKTNKEKVPMSEKGYEHCYTLPVTNDLMEPRFKAGDILIVDPEKNPKDGSFVIAYQKGASEAMFKKYVVDGARRYLRSLQGDVPRIDMDETITIFGVVVRKRSPDDIIEND